MSPRPFMIWFVVALAATTAGCSISSDGSSNANDGDRARIASRDGSLIMTRSDGLYEMEVATGDLRKLVTPVEPGSFVLDPAISPSARQVAYIVQPPPRVADGMYDAGSDIWIANRDGSNPQRVFEHQQANQLVRYPHWVDDRTLYAIILEIEDSQGLTTSRYTLQRIDLADGQRVITLDNVIAFDISPDGSRIAYAQFDRVDGESFHAVDIDGHGRPVELVLSTEQLAPFNSPHYSPDGQRIAFAAADQNVPLPTGVRMVSAQPLATTLDGLPQDIWLIDADGSAPQLAAELGEDVPALTWGGDGQFIYVLGARALYEIDVTSGLVQEIGDGVFHGQLVWAPGD